MLYTVIGNELGDAFRLVVDAPNADAAEIAAMDEVLAKGADADEVYVDFVFEGVMDDRRSKATVLTNGWTTRPVMGSPDSEFVELMSPGDEGKMVGNLFMDSAEEVLAALNKVVQAPEYVDPEPGIRQAEYDESLEGRRR